MKRVDENLFGKDPKIQRAVAIARNVSVTKSPVLITGEVGVGKKNFLSIYSRKFKPFRHAL